MTDSRIRWPQLDESTFNELVENLLVREFTTAGQIAMAIDGRGGDGGIDVDVRAKRTDQLIRIFQLKYFPEGFSGGHVNRRSQIKRSLLEAMKLKPSAWTLVVPRNMTVKERQAVRAMGKSYDVKISFMTPTDMDLLLAKYPDIEERFTTDRAIELLKAVHREEAALVRAGDLKSEVDRLADRLHGRSEYWGTSFALNRDGSYLETYFPKRPDAADREPLSAHFTLGFTPDDEQLKSQWESAMKFGTTERLVIPTRVVRSFEKRGPDWFREVLDNVELHLGPAPDEHASRPIRVEARDASGHAVSSLRGKTVSLAHGYGGMTFDAELEGGVNQRWILPSQADDTGSITFNTDFSGRTAREIRRALRFSAAVDTNAELALIIDGMAPIIVNVGGQTRLAPDTRFESFVDDVCALEDYFELDLRLPEEIDSTDFIWARIMRMLIQGTATVHPFNGTFGGTLDGTSDPSLDSLLSEGSAVVVQQPGFGVEFFGEELLIDTVTYYAHHAVADDAAEISEAIKAGAAAGTRIALRPVDGLPWVIYSPTHLARAGHETVIAHPWEIEGIREHAGFSRLPNRRRDVQEDKPGVDSISMQAPLD